VTPALRRILVSIAMVLIAIGAVAFLLARHHRAAPPPAQAKPTLLLLTSLPLIFNEQFSLEGGGSPALAALQSRYRVLPISVTDKKELAKGRLLLMAHPLAQPAEDLVALDNWVRAGGRVVLLADPLLEWPSARPIGDPLRPPPMFMDTGLLSHWGLRLDGPDRRGPVMRQLGGFAVLTVSPGSLSGSCAISADRLVAHCSVGKGHATVIADADFLDSDRLGPAARRNLDALLAELAAGPGN
jgi:hypothetical protein